MSEERKSEEEVLRDLTDIAILLPRKLSEEMLACIDRLYEIKSYVNRKGGQENEIFEKY